MLERGDQALSGQGEPESELDHAQSLLGEGEGLIIGDAPGLDQGGAGRGVLEDEGGADAGAEAVQAVEVALQAVTLEALAEPRFDGAPEGGALGVDEDDVGGCHVEGGGGEADGLVEAGLGRFRERAGAEAADGAAAGKEGEQARSVGGIGRAVKVVGQRRAE